MKEIINDTKAPSAVGTYSQGVKVNGFYFFSGQIGINPENAQMQEGFDSQLEQVMNNIDALLNGCDLKRTDIVKTTIFLKDLGDFSKVNIAYENYFQAPYPARSCVEAARLPKDALVEIEVIATK